MKSVLKKLFALAFCLSMCLCIGYGAAAEEMDLFTEEAYAFSSPIIAGNSGNWGRLHWELSKAGVLSISGTGAMDNYPDSAPDYGWRGTDTVYSITEVIIRPGVTSIGKWAFNCCSNLKRVTLPEGITSIGLGAFDGCDNLSTVYYGGTQSQWGTISIAYGNDSLKNASKIYNSSAPATTYTISYNANGGKGAPADQTKTQGQTITLSSTKPSRSEYYGSYTVYFNANGGSVSPTSKNADRYIYYDFKNWNTRSDGSGTSYAPGASYSTDANLTLYAQWSSSGTVKTSSVYLPTPSREGYIFKGWATSRSATSGVTGNYTPSGNVTLYAVWVQSYTISYDANGGSDAPEKQVKTHGIDLTLSSKIPIRSSVNDGHYTVTLNANGGEVDTSSLAAETTTSYSFISWNTQSNGSGTSYSPGGSYTADADVSLYAQWNSTPTISAVTLPTPTRDSYFFKGWATSSNASSGITGSYTPEEDITLYAIWERQYTVTYDANGGSGAPESQTKTQGQSLILSSTKPTRSSSSAGSYTVTLNANGGSVSVETLSAQRTANYTFQNWNTRSSGIGTSYLPGASYTADADVTLYAQWSSRVTTAPVELPVPTRDGYVFKGWATNSNATSGVTGSYTPSGNVTLYAAWQQVSAYTVSYDANGGSDAPEKQVKTHGIDLTLSSKIPIRSSVNDGHYTVTLNANGGEVDTSSLAAEITTSYSFISWNTQADGNGISYLPGASYTADADVMLYAQWRSSATVSSVTLPTPTRSDYTFMGWSPNANAFTGYIGSYTPEANVTLYAVWQHKSIVYSGYCGNNLFWTLDNQGRLIISGSGKMEGSPWSRYKTEIKTAIVGSGIASISDEAFSDCSSLKSVTIPDSVTSIGKDAFKNCSALYYVYIHDIASWCRIDFKSYASNPLSYAHNLYLNNTLVQDLVIPEGVTSIGDRAFYECRSLTSVTIPDSVTSIGYDAFYGYMRLRDVYIHDIAAWCRIDFKSYASNPLYYTHNLYLNNTLVQDLVIPDSVSSIGDMSFYDCRSLTSVTIPDSVTSIGYDAFNGCINLTSINIPDSVTSIGNSAFSYCNSLTSVTIGDSVTSIGNSAFSGCNNLTSVTISDSVTSIGESAFYCEALKGVYIHDIASWCRIDFKYDTSNPLYYAHNLYLNNTLVQDLVIPDSVTSIGDYAFYRCSSLTSVTIPDSVTSIGEDAFYQCGSLRDVYIHDIASWCRIDFKYSTSNPLYYAHNLYLNNTLVQDLVIPDSVTSIGYSAFYNCSSLTSVTIPDSVTSIGSRAFEGCSNLTSINIPDSITSIGMYAFYNCSGLNNVYYNGTKSQWSEITINKYNNSLLNAARHYVLLVKFITNGGSAVETQWVESGNSAVKPVEPTREVFLFDGWYTDEACESEFSFNTPIRTNTTLYARWFAPDFILPASLTVIGREAFTGNAFVFARLSEQTKTIGVRAFANCPNLKIIYIPAATTKIDPQAFGEMQMLTILGRTGSTADSFAEEHGYTFIALS